MSTILNALQKQTSNQAYNMPSMQSNRHWKVALFISLLIIIALLTTLIFILLKPPMHSASVAIQPETVLQAKPANAQLPPIKAVQQEKPAPKLISKVFFQTKRLPISAKETTSDDLKIDVASVIDVQQPVVLSGETKQPEEVQKIDYSNVSNELQQRFEHALLMSQDEGKAFVENENSDGTDIHQMASDFQDQLPALSYDFHVYSSVAKDRWIRINGEDLVEGQFDSSGKIQVVEIQANRSVFRLGSQSFSLQSLTDWRAL